MPYMYYEDGVHLEDKFTMYDKNTMENLTCLYSSLHTCPIRSKSGVALVRNASTCCIYEQNLSAPVQIPVCPWGTSSIHA